MKCILVSVCFVGVHILLQRREHQDEETVGICRSMAASRSSRVTRSSVGLNGLDENFCGRTLRNRSIAQPEETSVSPLPRARSPKKKQESKQDTKQDVKQDTKQDAKNDTKQDAKEDTKQDCQHQASLQGKVTDLNASPAEAEQWTGSRKRGMSCLEHDTLPEKSENCDRGTGPPDICTQIKRAKRCSRSGESQGLEEDPELLRPDSPISVTEPSKDIVFAEVPSRNSANTSPASPVLAKEEGELTGETADDGHVQCDGAPQALNTHKASNGLGENKTEELSAGNEDLGTNPASATNCPSLLNGSQMGVPSSPDPTVPCTISAPTQVEISSSGELPASSAPTFEAIPDDPVPELTLAKGQEMEEVEVDVVSESLCLAHEEQVIETENDSNGLSTPVQEAAASSFSASTNLNSSSVINSNSGETSPPLTTSPSLTEPGCNPSVSSTSPSFTELYEHRYTLRTSPRRAATGGKTSSTKLSSSPRDNGHIREEEEVLVGPEEDCPMVEESAPADSVGPSVEEPVSVDPKDGECEEERVPVEYKETERSQELTQSQTTKEEEEEEEPDVYYFESDHLALKHNKEYV